MSITYPKNAVYGFLNSQTGKSCVMRCSSVLSADLLFSAQQT